MSVPSKKKTEKRFQVGDTVEITGKDGEVIGGKVIDYQVYKNPDRRILQIQLSNGKFEEISEEDLRKNLSRRR